MAPVLWPHRLPSSIAKDARMHGVRIPGRLTHTTGHAEVSPHAGLQVVVGLVYR
jgi:hypothetical protein